MSLTSAAAVVVSQDLRPEVLSTPDWLSVCVHQHSTIFEGPEEATESMLMLLQPYLRTPTLWRRAPLPLEFPTGECGALVLRNVSALDRDHQAALLRWLEAGPKQVITTTTRPLFPLIASGLFDEALYYRLNVMRLNIDATGAITR